ncbi:MAG: histidine kinase dimerization/phosphoacceptor domain -containing protein [Pseudomonadota bacterium]
MNADGPAGAGLASVPQVTEATSGRRRFFSGVRGRLLILVFIATIPVLGTAGGHAWLNYERGRDLARQTALIIREGAVARQTAMIETTEEMLNGLARRTDLLSATPEVCNASMQALLALFRDRYTNIWLIDGEGRLRCSALPAEAGRDLTATRTWQAPVAARQFALSDFIEGELSGRSVMPAASPMFGEDGSLQGVIAAAVLLDYLAVPAPRNPGLATYDAWLVDRQGTTLAITNAGVSVLPSLAQLNRLQADGAMIEGMASDGMPHLWSTAVLAPNLRMVIGVPVGELHAMAASALRDRIIELAVFLSICIIAILVGAEMSVSRPMRRLARSVHEWAPGQLFRPGSRANDPDEVVALDSALSRASTVIADREQALRAAIGQRDLLMAEIHHRVKNNLQIIASLLSMQAARLEDPRANLELGIARDRVQALATLHRHLYLDQSYRSIAMRPFLEELCRQLGDAMDVRSDERINVTIDADSMEIASDSAISLALLVTEAVSNALRHAFPEGRLGTIAVSFKQEGDMALLRIADDGVGIAGTGEGGTGLGMQLIRGFAQHLGGEAAVTHEHGTEITLRIPIELITPPKSPTA